MSPPSQQVPFPSYVPHAAIVTGASSGEGYAIAHRLADDGFDVAVNDIGNKQKQVVEGLRQKGRRALAIPGDVSSEPDVVPYIQKTVHELGSVDIMIANWFYLPIPREYAVSQYASYPSLSNLIIASVETLDKSYAVNVRHGGRLIEGKQGGPNLTAYSASKFAIRGLTQSASIELRRYSITDNSYAPGFVRTLLTTADGKDDDCVTVKELLGVPIDTPVSGPDTIASIVSYLVKPEAYFVNGQCISVDGGLRYD